VMDVVVLTLSFIDSLLDFLFIPVSEQANFLFLVVLHKLIVLLFQIPAPFDYNVELVHHEHKFGRES
jgi:hypothetical protein